VTVGAEEWAVVRVEPALVHVAAIEGVEDRGLRLGPVRAVASDTVDRIFSIDNQTARLGAAQVRVEWLTRDLARVSSPQREVGEAHGLVREGDRWAGTVPADELQQVRSDLTEWARDPVTGAWA
jgi:hypothetical protein